MNKKNGSFGGELLDEKKDKHWFIWWRKRMRTARKFGLKGFNVSNWREIIWILGVFDENMNGLKKFERKIVLNILKNYKKLQAIGNETEIHLISCN